MYIYINHNCIFFVQHTIRQLYKLQTCLNTSYTKNCVMNSKKLYVKCKFILGKIFLLLLWNNKEKKNKIKKIAHNFSLSHLSENVNEILFGELKTFEFFEIHMIYTEVTLSECRAIFSTRKKNTNWTPLTNLVSILGRSCTTDFFSNTRKK